MFYTISSSDFYNLLQIPRDAPSNDIKMAYHRTLLRLHPDKHSLRNHDSILASVPSKTDTPTDATQSRLPLPPPEEASVDMALLKEAYRTLSDVSLRAAYDGLLRWEEHEHGQSCGPRPAQVVSLEEFIEVEAVTEMAHFVEEWRYGCRCGGTYRITQDDLENGTHLVSCESCSEVIWVGYEEVVILEDGHEHEEGS
ncbi:hypothetical protein J3R82DRAFT_285 [Butyriboletus roseoflavus]|nr:hypothetical protein J3R82DRAFT_285 [Butyriboletus roseoflavus]